MKYPKLRELREAVKALIKGPYTSDFPDKPHIPAKRFRGRPVPDNNGCIGCGACAEVCPAGAIEIADLPENSPVPLRSLTWHYDMCIFCAQCERQCTTGEGVKLSNTEFDLATLNRKNLSSELRKELVLCSDCGNIVGTKEHILWLVKKLGPKANGNITLLSYHQKELSVIENIPQEKAPLPLKRPHLFMIVCPKCRHKVLVFDEFSVAPQK